MDSIEKIRTLDIEILGPLGADDEKRMIDFQEKHKIELPADYVQLMRSIGDFQFTRFLKIKSVERIPKVMSAEQFAPVTDFLTWKPGKTSIEEKHTRFLQLFPQTTFIPFCNGLLWDLIGFWYKSKTDYIIGYTFHGGLPGYTTYHLANSFHDFVDGLSFAE
jgi:hypothetical protein